MKIGIDLGGTNVRMGVVNNGVIVKKISERCKADQPEDVVIKQLTDMLYQIISPEIESIGIGVPSVVDAQKGIVYNVMNIPSWKEVHLKEILEKEFNIPVFVNNDCNCFALGEYHFGEGAGSKDLVAVALGTGVGSGIIIDGKLYNGGNTGAGEVGCIPYLEYDYESYCSSSYFTRVHGITGKDAFEKAKANEDVDSIILWNQFGHHVGDLMKVILFAYDPRVIILGGSIANAYEYFAPAMMDSLDSFPYPETVKNLKIYTSKVEDVAILGASTLS